MSAPTTGPCSPWTTDEEVRGCCSGLSKDFELDGAIAFASSVLYRLSGRQWAGTCERTVRPCFGDNCGCGSDRYDRYTYGWQAMNFPPWDTPTWPALIDGQIYNIGCCGGLCELQTVTLPAPVGSISKVVIDGEILDPSAYRVVQHRRLARLDGVSWPCSQDYTRESGAYVDEDPPIPNDGSRDGTWQIEYAMSSEPDAAARFAASVFACEIAKGQCGADDCVLPQRLKEITRDGVSMAFADSLDFLESVKPPRVGITEVDIWLRSVNPFGLQRRSKVRRADAPNRWNQFT